MSKRPDLASLEVFLALRRRGTMKAVTKREGVLQPTISRHLKALGEHYQATLRRRNGEVTEVGEAVADYAERILALVDELDATVAALREGRAGRVVVGASGTVGEQFLPDALKFFYNNPCHRGIDVEVRIGNSEDITARVRDRELSFGLVGRPRNEQNPGAEGRFPEELVPETVFPDSLVVFVAGNHELPDHEPVGPAALTGADFVLRERGSATRRQAEISLARIGVAPRRVIELGSNQAVSRVVEAGVGVGVLSRRAIARDLEASLPLDQGDAPDGEEGTDAIRRPPVARLRVLDVKGWRGDRDHFLIYRRDRAEAFSRAEILFKDSIRPTPQAQD